MALKCDVTSWDEQVTLFKTGYEKYGRIDYVVPNAGKAYTSFS
jgi:NAD(P)-dependent dehydrogenase (short-subunit alcohol dehydrogenase family)